MNESWSRLRLMVPESRLAVVLGLVAAVGLVLVGAWAFNLGPFAGPSLPATAAAPVPAIADTQAGPLPVAFDVGVKLVAVIALIYVLSAFSKRYLLRISPDAPGNLRVVEARPLGPKKTLYLVEIGGRMLVLGATESTINNLAEFSDPEVVAQLRSQPQEGAGLDFPRLLSAVRGSGIRASRSDFAASLVPSGFPASPARALKSEHTTVDSE